MTYLPPSISPLKSTYDVPDQTHADGNIGIQVIGADLSQVYDAFLAPRHTPNIPYDIRDSIISSAPPLLSSFICQKWPVPAVDHLPTSICHESANDTAKPDCAVMFSNWLGDGPMFLMHYCILAVNCGSVPVLPTSPAPGQLPVIVMSANTDVIPCWIFLATLMYFYSHDQSQLFLAVLGRVSPCWHPTCLFPAGQRKTSAPPAIIADNILEEIAMSLTQKELDLLETHVQGFSYTQLSLDITDLGFQEVISTTCTIVNKAHSLRSWMFFSD
ncbi:hypothetical protein EDD85DRAFT_337803 [Armillaria nabsnona]|nr:hypothetical protein EDD85DRAFT_337803 [Armillaria nabsnona]